MVATDHGVYLATNVTRRFTTASNEILRIDPATLLVGARATMPEGAYALAGDTRGLWVGFADEVLRLDSTRLSVLARFRISGTAQPPVGTETLGSMGVGSRGLWVLYGDVSHSTLLLLDPQSLRVRERRPIPAGLGAIAAWPSGAWLAGLSQNEVLRIDPTIGTPVVVTQGGELIEGVAPVGSGLIVVLSNHGIEGSLLIVDAAGRIIARTDGLGDLGSVIAVDARNIWILQAAHLARFVLETHPT